VTVDRGRGGSGGITARWQATLEYVLVDLSRGRIRLRVDLAQQGLPEPKVLLESLVALARAGVQAHQAHVRILVRWLGDHDALEELDGRFQIAPLVI
jgi:hypothetical protein